MFAKISRKNLAQKIINMVFLKRVPVRDSRVEFDTVHLSTREGARRVGMNMQAPSLAMFEDDTGNAAPCRELCASLQASAEHYRNPDMYMIVSKSFFADMRRALDSERERSNKMKAAYDAGLAPCRKLCQGLKASAEHYANTDKYVIAAKSSIKDMQSALSAVREQLKQMTAARNGLQAELKTQTTRHSASMAAVTAQHQKDLALVQKQNDTLQKEHEHTSSVLQVTRKALNTQLDDMQALEKKHRELEAQNSSLRTEFEAQKLELQKLQRLLAQQGGVDQDTAPDIQSNTARDPSPDVQSNIAQDAAPDIQSNIARDPSPDVQSNIAQDAAPDIQSNIAQDALSDKQVVAAKPDSLQVLAQTACQEASRLSPRRMDNTGICPHGKRKDSCVFCNLNLSCAHKARRRDCQFCSTSSHCEHKGRFGQPVFKKRCRVCSPHNFCQLGCLDSKTSLVY